MSDKSPKKNPYILLGYKIRNIREKKNETIEQVAGAVEVDKELLMKFETGIKLPDEDILLLLISHFDLKNDEAKKVWQLAGYESIEDDFKPEFHDSFTQVPTIVIVPFDNKILYSDLVQVSSNNYGLVLNFMQANLTKNTQPQFVSRIGISKEHAADIVKMLSQALKDDLLESDKKSDNQTGKK
jgi:transcriptional regulator with XRE-family HTH domain